jgi:hypothetical protein
MIRSAGTRSLANTHAVRRVMDALATIFNVLLLNVLVLLASIPVVTLPLAVRAGWAAWDRWRDHGEDRVAREFWLALRTAPIAQTFGTIGLPLVGIALATTELHYFLNRRSPMAYICLGLAFTLLFIATGVLTFGALLSSRSGQMPTREVLALAIRLAVGNALATVLPSLAVGTVAAFIVVVDPALLLLGVPIAALALIRRLALIGMRRSGMP